MSKMSLLKRRAVDRGDSDIATPTKQPAVARSSAESKGKTPESATSIKSTKSTAIKSFKSSQQTAGGRLNKAMKYAMQRHSAKSNVPRGAKGKEGHSNVIETREKSIVVTDMSDSECTAENVSLEESDEGEYTVEIVPPTLTDTEEESPHENGEVSIHESTATTDRSKKQMRGNYDINALLESAVATSQNGGSKEDENQKRTYKREFNIPCAYCEVMLKDYGYLFRHVTRLHKNEPDVDEYVDEIRPRMRTACPICNKTVSSASNVSAHIKQCHADTDCAVKCPLCKKSYKTQISLKQHIRQCHQPQVRKHKCNFCDMTFTENRSLREHINCTHETTQIFRCDDCGKTFLTKGRLRRHKYIHSDFRHYCPYCNKGFHLKDNMNKHVEIMHEKKFGKRFQCPHCPKSFTVKGNMKQHIMGVHLRQYAYSCPICGEGYRRKKDMLLHMEQHKEGMSTLKIEDVKIDPHTIKLPPPSVKVQMAPTDGSTTGTTVIEVLPQNIKVMTE